MRRIIIAVVVLAVVLGGSWFVLQATAEEKEPPPPDYEVFVVPQGDISSTVSATGSIEPANAVNLNFRGAGRVEEVNVEAGDEVTAGQVLARLESADLQLAVDQANIGLRLAQARLAQAQRDPEEFDIAAAEAAVESARAAAEAARASYQDLLRGATASQRRAAEASEKRARVMLDASQRAYNDIAHLPNAGMLPQAMQLEQSTIDYEVAKANVQNTLAAATAGQKAGALAQIAQSESAVLQAEAALSRLLQGIAAEDLMILDVQVEQAALAVRQAELAMENIELLAPIDGVVGAVNVKTNEFPNPALPAFVLTDTSGHHIELNVDEIDIAQLSVGQPAVITIDALDDVEITGVVSNIAPIAASGVSGLGGASIVTYIVTVDIDPSDVPLRAGLTSTVSITTDEARDVVLLPNRVMRLDRQNGQTYVEKIVNGIPQRTNVVIGLRNEQFSQILEGVEIGDELAIRQSDTGDALRQQFFGG